MNRYGYYYEVIYRLDDLEDYDNTEYSGEINSKKEAFNYANEIIKQYGERVVLLDINKYNDEELLDGYSII